MVEKATTLLTRLLQLLPAETAHRVAIRGLPLLSPVVLPELPRLEQRVFGLSFATPIGLAAGFDKNAEVFEALLDQGFSFVETGTVTPRPQSGNARPRLFRLTADAALINRMGFNNDGLDAVATRLASREAGPGIVGANIGINKDSENPIKDYVNGFERLAPLVDYVTVNVSSPNTPGLRGWQQRDRLLELLTALLAGREDRSTPLLLKIAPDIDDQAEEDIAATVLETGIDGLIVSNTTIERPIDLVSESRHESGGLSGQPLFAPSTELLRRMRRRIGPNLPLIGVGGIASGADAYAKIRAGASLVQLYTAMIFEGPGIARRIALELNTLLLRDGYASVADAVGVDAD